jgi:sulfonate transport system ATP-binding protein
MLTVESIDKTYPNGVHALDRFSLDIAQGEIVAIVGGSGCGKSTLLRLAAGLDQPTHGRIRIDGETITSPRPEVGLIFQEPRLLPWLTVAENICFGLSDRPRKERAKLCGEVLRRVGLADYANSWPRELSGGQAQRVAIGRALAPRPKVLLLDEPFSAVDAFTRASLHEHLLDLWSALRLTLVLVTHDVEEAAFLADRVIVMKPRPGRVAAEFEISNARPRERYGEEVEADKRRILSALGRSFRTRAAGEELAPAAAI